MSVLSIRNLPEDVARALKRLAGARGQSVESLARATLVDLARPTLHAQEADFWADVRAGLKPGDAEALDAACSALDNASYQPISFR